MYRCIDYYSNLLHMDEKLTVCLHFYCHLNLWLVEMLFGTQGIKRHYHTSILPVVIKHSVTLLRLCLHHHVVALNNHYSLKNLSIYLQAHRCSGLVIVFSFPVSSDQAVIILILFGLAKSYTT